MAVNTPAKDRAECGPSSVVASTWDGHGLLAAYTAAAACLEANKHHVDALNVFPVPDGDTGANMMAAMRAALDEARRTPSERRSSAYEIAATIAHGALMGAGGNSAVILSQFFRGFAEGIADRATIEGRDLARALARASDRAYNAVMRPVEGTMLTVIRVAAEHAAATAEETPDLAAVLAEALQGATVALAETPQQLDVLRQAGVVDAGGQGIVHILDGMVRSARGEEITAPTDMAFGDQGAEMTFLDRVGDSHNEDAFGYCTNFMIFGEEIDFETVRAEIATMGESAVIVGDDRIVKIHIHTLNPGSVLDYAVGLGELGQIRIDNMNAQTRALIEQRNARRATTAHVSATSMDAPQPIGRQAVVAVVAGDGLAEALRSMGATGIVRGGQSANPTTKEILQAVEEAPANEVIVLPNNPNVILAANQVAPLTEKSVRVVPSRSAPQGLAALEAFNAGANLDQNAARMEKAIEHVRTIELTRAIRDATIDGVAVTIGQAIALLDDRLVAGGDDDAGVLQTALQVSQLDAAELVTMFLGQDVSEADAAALAAVIAAACPDAEIEMMEGGQPHYRFIIGIQ